MYDFQERNRTAFHLTGSELRCSISPSVLHFTHSRTHLLILFFFVISITLWSFLSSCLSPDRTGCFDRSAHASWRDERKETWCVIDPKEPLFPSSDAAGYFPSPLSVHTCQLPPPPAQCPNLPCLQAFTW